VRKKKILGLIIAVVLAYVLWLSNGMLRFKTYTLDSPDTNPLEIQGAYHMHTIYSDGREHPDKIAEYASSAALDFIILTDHGNPNFECLGSEGWNQGVLVLAGSEFNVNRGHLVALDIGDGTQPFSGNAEQVAHQIRALKGLTIIAHPFSKTHWSWGEHVGYSGIEIINANTMWKMYTLHAIPYLPAALIKPDYALIKMLKRPEKNLKKWDELNEISPVYGYFSVDAHLLYRPLLTFLQLHLLLEDPLSSEFEIAKRQVFDALRKGRFYNAVDTAAEARGFRFWAKTRNRRVLMGSSVPVDSPVILKAKAPYPFARELRLIHNGDRIFSSSESEISIETSKPGIYRVEVYLKEKSALDKNIPWIVSNPIFLREKNHERHRP
jgi:hypothetical protein